MLRNQRHRQATHCRHYDPQRIFPLGQKCYFTRLLLREQRQWTAQPPRLSLWARTRLKSSAQRRFAFSSSKLQTTPRNHTCTCWSNKHCCSRRTMSVSVPGHSPLKFKQIEKIKEPLVLETCILVDRQQHASVFVPSRVVAPCLREPSSTEKPTLVKLCFVSVSYCDLLVGYQVS